MAAMGNSDQKLADLFAYLDDPDKPTLRAATQELILLAAESRQIREALERRLAEPGHPQYWPAAYVLGHLPEPSALTIQTLLDALDHREADIRWAVSLLLARMAGEDRSIIDSLIGLCAGGGVNQKRMAIYCLRDLALSDTASLQAILNCLSDADSTVRVAAAASLKFRADQNPLVRKALLHSYLSDPEIKVQNAAAVTLASLGAPCEEFLAALEQASENPNGQVRKAAAVALQLLKNNKARSTR